jgi:hypothetical protein
MMSEKDPHKETNDSFDKVFLDEMTKWVCKLPKYTNGAEEPGSPDHPDPRNKLVGLAMSGGGTRSATFNLGVTQVLAHYGLMSQVDYMSTVSCGGYLGPRSHRSALTNSPLGGRKYGTLGNGPLQLSLRRSKSISSGIR